MAYVDPNSVHNPSTGAAAPASWGDQVRDDLQAVFGPPRCRLSRSAFMSISDSTLTSVTWDTETYDSHGAHSTSSNTERITIPADWGGGWLIGAGVGWDLNTTGRRYMQIWLNGVLKIAEMEMQVETAAGNSSGTMMTHWQFAAGDYFELKVYQTSGGSLNLNNSDYSLTMWAAFNNGTVVG